MKQGSTLILRAVVTLLGVIVLGLCIFALPAGIQSQDVAGYHQIFWGMYVPTIPFFIALYQTWKLLDYIDRNKVFSKVSVKALKNVKYCALAISALYAAGMPYIFMVADRDDAPGGVIIGLVIIGTSLVIATSAAVLQTVLQSAIAIKSENDLTV